MVDNILKISKSGVFDIRCLSLNTAMIVLMKNATWIEDDIKVVSQFPCLLGHPVGYQNLVTNCIFILFYIQKCT